MTEWLNGHVSNAAGNQAAAGSARSDAARRSLEGRISEQVSRGPRYSADRARRARFFGQCSVVWKISSGDHFACSCLVGRAVRPHVVPCTTEPEECAGGGRLTVG